LVDRLLKNNQNEIDSCDIQLGYSFGCVSAIIAGNKNPKTKQIILIAPYIYPNKKVGAVLKTLLKTSFFKNSLLPKIAAKKISQMLIDSSYPINPTAQYLEDGKAYLDPEKLAQSLLEKDIDKSQLDSALSELASKNIPILIIMGDEDQVSKTQDQLEVFKKFKNCRIETIKQAGHALLWTHTQNLAQIISQPKLGYFQGLDKQNNVVSFLKEHKNKFPNNKILSWVNPEDLKKWNGDINTAIPHQSVTVSELDFMVGILSHEFKNLGIQFNDRVILFLPMSLYMYAAMFALQKMGAIPTFLDSWARRDQMGVSAKVAKPAAMISADRAFMYLSDVPEINEIKIKIVAGAVTSSIAYVARLEELLGKKIYDDEAPVEKEHTALITFTTGSSGTPKGADRSHRFLAAQHYALNRHLPYGSADKDLPVFPIFSLNNLAAGVETIIPAIDVGQPAATDAAVLYVQMKSSGVTCTTLSPSLFNELANFCIAKNLKLDFLKRVVTGGAPISRDDVTRMKSVAEKAEILVLYGSTEVEPMAHIEATEMLADTSDQDPEIVEIGVNVGHIDSGLKYHFIKISKENVFINGQSDWNQQLALPHEVGELIVAGEHVCEKYFNNDEAFFRAKIRDEKGIVWHRTGDLGLVDEKDNLWIVGRVHNAIKRSENYFFPVRAEIILKKFSFVQKAAFLGVPDTLLNEKTYAVFSTVPGLNEIEKYKNEIRRVMEKNNFIVDEIIHIDDIPMDPRHHSKVEYDILRKKICTN
jgi:acyl-CoA synthetase (AMP-forming)/AMP-acid ligase II